MKKWILWNAIKDYKGYIKDCRNILMRKTSSRRMY